MYGNSGTPWGMIQARKERDDLDQELRKLREMVLSALDTALTELNKPRGSRLKVRTILNGLRSHVAQISPKRL